MESVKKVKSLKERKDVIFAHIKEKKEWLHNKTDGCCCAYDCLYKCDRFSKDCITNYIINTGFCDLCKEYEFCVSHEEGETVCPYGFTRESFLE